MLRCGIETFNGNAGLADPINERDDVAIAIFYECISSVEIVQDHSMLVICVHTA